MSHTTMIGTMFYTAILSLLMACAGNEADATSDATDSLSTSDSAGVEALLSAQDTNKMTSAKMTIGDTVSTPSGLKVILRKKGNGIQAEAGMKVNVHYTGKLTDGKVFDSSVERGQPFAFNLGAGMVIPGWDEGIAMLAVGDQATLLIPSHLGYGPRGAGAAIPPNADLIFEVELLDAKATPKPVPYDVEGKKIEKTPSGLQYIVVKENDGGEQAYANMTAAVHYTLYLADGTIIDSSIPRGETLPFKIGTGGVIRGFDEGVRLMKTGEKFRLIIPPSIGYGAQDNGPIPANSTLIFDVELVSLSK